MKKKLPITAVVIIVIAVILVCFGGRGYKSVIKSFAKAYLSADAKKLVSLLPNGTVQALIDDWFEEKEEIVSDVQSELDTLIRELKSELNDNMKISYEIISVDDYTGEYLENLKQDYFDSYGEKIVKGKEVTLEFKAKDKDMSCTQTTKFIIVKIGHSWYWAYMGSISRDNIYTSRQYED